MSDNTFKCECCQGVFELDPDWTEEDRLSEMQDNIGDIPEDDRAQVCNDCYDLILATQLICATWIIKPEKLDPRVEAIMREIEIKLLYGDDHAGRLN